jgi:hypothetical protein
MNLAHLIAQAASKRGDGLEPRLAQLLAARIAQPGSTAHIHAEATEEGFVGPASARILALPGAAPRRPATTFQPQGTHENRR